MRNSFFDIQYFETYYFANIVNNVLSDPYNYNYLGGTNEFFGEEHYFNFVEPFPKISALHHYIKWMINTINFEDVEELDIDRVKNNSIKLWVEVAFDYYNFHYDTFDVFLLEKNKSRETVDIDDVYDYIHELQLCGPYEELLEKMSEEIFHIMFLNRKILLNFNSIISSTISQIQIEEIEETEEKELFSKDGRLKRVHIPTWVKNAVFHRDKGKCVLCFKDLSGLVSISEKENFDHIIPLSQGGINDITNIQLLCESCNKKKRDGLIGTSELYEKWY